MEVNELLDMAWSIYECVEDHGDLILSDLLDGVERDYDKATRDKIEYLLEVECNLVDM